MANEIRQYLRIAGRVQGVGFRFFTARAAQDLKVTGFVRNRADGGVEVEVQGTAERVAGLIAAVRRGPALGRVDSVVISDRLLQADETGFVVRS